MTWTELRYTPEEVDRAGAILIGRADIETYDDFVDAVDVINNWRACHYFPLNTFQVTLRRKARLIYGDSLVAQRIKRLSSIDHKLRRFDWLRLSAMQDIGGCRAVLKSVPQIEELVRLYKDSDLKHGLVDEDNYIEQPKRSGYRGVHLIYEYYSDRKETYNGLKIEMQFRSQLQHAWATAVETVGTFIQQALKSSVGEKDWLRFFALMGTEIAVRENTSPVPHTPTNTNELRQELRDYASRLDVEGKLQAYGNALRAHEQGIIPGAHYFLLRLNAADQTVTVRGFRARELEAATKEYATMEQQIRSLPPEAGGDAVLVSVESMQALRRAYPNYFLDTREFLTAVKQAIK
jgi:hypothetical protein